MLRETEKRYHCDTEKASDQGCFGIALIQSWDEEFTVSDETHSGNG
jgi:hypothetical protein